MIIGAIFITATVALAYKFIPYLHFYKYDLAKNVEQRVFLASNYEGSPSVDSTQKTTDEINRERRELIPQKLSSSGFDHQNVVILEEPSPISPQFGDGKVEIVKYFAENVVVKTDSEQPKLLFLGNPFYFGWKARVNGEEVKVLRANYSFMVVPLVGGEHVAEFYYDNSVFIFGMLVSLSLIALLFFTRARSRL